MSKKVVDTERYANFLVNNPLSESLSNEWFGNEILAQSILFTLVEKGILDYHDVLNKFDIAAKSKLRSMLELYEEDIIKTPQDFLVDKNILDSKTIKIRSGIAWDEFASIINHVIPQAIIRKYKDKKSILKESRSFNSLCQAMLTCDNLQDMYDLFIVAFPRDQHLMVDKLVEVAELFGLIPKETIIKFPATHVARIKLFLSGQINLERLLF